MFTSPVPSGKIQPYPDRILPSSPRSSRCELIHGSSDISEATYDRPATPYTVSRCHSRPSTLPSGERTPSATTSRRQPISTGPLAVLNTTAVTRSPSRRTSNARCPSTATAPALIAVVRRWSSSSVRATAEPQSGSDPPGQGSSRVWPKPCARKPWFTVWARSQSSRPSRCSSPIARGVSPSPHVLSRGNTAASTSTTSAPARAAHAAAADPAGPAPTTSTSVLTGALVVSVLVTRLILAALSVSPVSRVSLHVWGVATPDTCRFHRSTGETDDHLEQPGRPEGPVVDSADDRLLAGVV